jgi:hypothetical protein
MKKLFTLVALLACFLGAKAEWVQDYKIDYSTHSGFPFYVMGYVPEWFDGVMTDFGANYKYVAVEGAEETSDVIVKTEGGVEYYKIPVEGGAWHQYFIADGIPTEIDGSYTVKAMVKASEACSINVNMGWGWGDGQQVGTSVSIPTEWTEVEWEYSGIAGTSCNLVAQPGTVAATIEWKYVIVGHNQKAQRPTTWQEWMTSDGQAVVVETTPAAIPNWMGNAETPWADPNVKFNDQEKNYLICAWGKEKGVNMNENDGWDPFPATIESEEVDGKTNHYFIVHGQPATTEGDASAWDNQFWIQSPKEWKAGETVKIHFRYKASKDVKVATQCHKQNPSDYLIWHAIGDIEFTTEWKEFDSNMTIGDDMGGTWSIAFQLNQNDKEAIDFLFDDLSWQSMVLDEGYFVAGCNTATGLEYDLDNAVEFQFDEEAGVLIAEVGEKGKADTYVNQLMISTVRGNDASFKSNTLKPSGAITNDPDNWMDYTASSIAKLTLPGSGVWKVYLDTDYKAMAFEMLEGEIKDPIDIVTNTTAIVVHGQERDWLGTNDDGSQKEEGGVGQGQPWDNQFWFVANRTLSAGEVTVLKFKYKASKEAKTTTQCHNLPGQYIHWAAIGDVTFTEEWQDFEADFTIPAECNGADNNGYKNDFKSITFNMAEIKEACDYEIKDVQWYLKDGVNENGKTWENLINETGTENFWVKEGAGTEPYQFGGGTGINNVVNNKKTGSAVIYNLAGQRVSKDYKGIVVKDNKKVVLK